MHHNLCGNKMILTRHWNRVLCVFTNTNCNLWYHFLMNLCWVYALFSERMFAGPCHIKGIVGHAMLARCVLRLCLSVYRAVTIRYSTKTAKFRITKSTPTIALIIIIRLHAHYVSIAVSTILGHRGRSCTWQYAECRPRFRWLRSLLIIRC